MAKLTEEDGRRSLQAHVVDKAIEARQQYGPIIDYQAMLKIFDDRKIVRYPTGIRFDASDLKEDEFAFATPLGELPTDGFCLMIHPWFEKQIDVLPALMAYHIPVINYGVDVVTNEEAEQFGAALMGLEVEAYYQWLCQLMDSMPREA